MNKIIELMSEHYILTFIIVIMIIVTIDNIVGSICKAIIISVLKKGDDDGTKRKEKDS